MSAPLCLWSFRDRVGLAVIIPVAVGEHTGSDARATLAVIDDSHVRGESTAATNEPAFTHLSANDNVQAAFGSWAQRYIAAPVEKLRL